MSGGGIPRGGNNMLRFEEAQELFLKWRNDQSAEVYKKASWSAYFAGRINDGDMQVAQKELTEFWSRDAAPRTN
jgi:hypothetical protein